MPCEDRRHEDIPLEMEQTVFEPTWKKNLSRSYQNRSVETQKIKLFIKIPNFCYTSKGTRSVIDHLPQ